MEIDFHVSNMKSTQVNDCYCAIVHSQTAVMMMLLHEPIWSVTYANLMRRNISILKLNKIWFCKILLGSESGTPKLTHITPPTIQKVYETYEKNSAILCYL